MAAKSWIGVAAGAAACFVVGAANAETKTIITSGAWEAFGGTTTKSEQICGFSTQQKSGYFGVKYIPSKNIFAIQLGPVDWPIKKNASEKATMRFDSRARTMVGIGMRFDDGDNGIEYTIRKDELAGLLRDFGTNKKLRIKFAHAGAKAWSLDLHGAAEVKAAFETCRSEIK